MLKMCCYSWVPGCSARGLVEGGPGFWWLLAVILFAFSFAGRSAWTSNIGSLSLYWCVLLSSPTLHRICSRPGDLGDWWSGIAPAVRLAASWWVFLGERWAFLALSPLPWWSSALSSNAFTPGLQTKPTPCLILVASLGGEGFRNWNTQRAVAQARNEDKREGGP